MTTRPARVVFVIGDLRRAGAETQLVRLATHLDRARYEPSIVTVRERNDFADELAGVPVSSLRRRSAWDVLVLRRLVHALRAARPDLVHSWLPFPNLLSAMAAGAAGIPVLLLAQRASYDATLTPFWRTVARRAHRRAQHVTVNSEAALREELAAGMPPEHVSLIRNGIEVPGQSSSPDRARLGLPQGPLVVCVAQFAAEKSHADLIEAWPRVRSAVPEAMLALVGEGALRREIEARAVAAGVRDSIHFLGFRAQAMPLLAAADVVVLASRTEGMPNAVLEAMAVARPVVATAVGGLPELVEHGRSGWLVAPRDPAAIADGLVTLLKDGALRRALGDQARQRILQHFSIEQSVRATEALYARWLGPVPA